MMERRRSVRVTPPRPLFGRVKAAEPARIIDLSRHGTRLEVRSRLAPASACRLSLPTADGEISVRATVRRCRAALPPDGGGLVFDAGLEFVGLAPDEAELIEDSIVDLLMTEHS